MVVRLKIQKPFDTLLIVAFFNASLLAEGFNIEPEIVWVNIMFVKFKITLISLKLY